MTGGKVGTVDDVQCPDCMAWMTPAELEEHARERCRKRRSPDDGDGVLTPEQQRESLEMAYRAMSDGFEHLRQRLRDAEDDKVILENNLNGAIDAQLAAEERVRVLEGALARYEAGMQHAEQYLSVSAAAEMRAYVNGYAGDSEVESIARRALGGEETDDANHG